MKTLARGFVSGPQFIPQLGSGLVGLERHLGGRERAVGPVTVDGQRRNERRTPGRAFGSGVAGHRNRAPGGGGEVGPEGQVDGAPPGHLNAAGPAGLVEHGQAAAALQDDAVDQRPGQMLRAVAEIKACDGAAQCARCVCDMRQMLDDEREALRYAAE